MAKRPDPQAGAPPVMDNLLNTAQVADRFGVTGATVRRWVTEGTLKPVGRTPGGQMRFDIAAIADFMTADSD